MEIHEQMATFAKTAQRYAESFDEVLDFSIKSIEAVERILDYYSRDLHD